MLLEGIEPSHHKSADLCSTVANPLVPSKSIQQEKYNSKYYLDPEPLHEAQVTYTLPMLLQVPQPLLLTPWQV